MIFSDGNLDKEKKKISIRISDYELAIKLFKIMCDNKKRILYEQKYINKNYKNSYLILNTNQETIKECENFGLEPNKSYSMKFPNIPEIYFKDFIRGYFDGDGSIYVSSTYKDKKYYGISFTSGSKDFLEKLRDILKNLNISSSIIADSRETNNSYYLKIYKQKDIKKFKNLIYENSQIHLKRKYDIFMNDIV